MFVASGVCVSPPSHDPIVAPVTLPIGLPLNMPVPRIVRVVPDETGIDALKMFDYLVPAAMANLESLRVGSYVRIPLGGRRVGGWVVEDDVTIDAVGSIERLKPIAKVSGYGPPPEVIDVARWAAWRWWGKPVHLLRAASSPKNVSGLPRRPPSFVVPEVDDPHGLRVLFEQSIAAFELGRAEGRWAPSLLQIPPAIDRFALLLAIISYARIRNADRVGTLPGDGGVLVLCPSLVAAEQSVRRLKRAGIATALYPDNWGGAYVGGCVVVGGRSAAWAPIARPDVVVVIDEHDERYKEERTPAWNARDVVIERARRLGVPCLLISPCLSLEAREAAGMLRLDSSESHAGHPLTLATSGRRVGWTPLEIIDRSSEDPARQGLISERIVSLLRSDGRVVCVLNRTGRAKLLVCATCSQMATCERCDGALGLGSNTEILVCQRCAFERPVVCASCGSAKMKNVRMGVTRAREELEALSLRPVGEIVAGGEPPADDVRLVVGTEAVLHRHGAADAVVFLDIDGELFAPRYRAAEQTLHLLTLATRLVGGRSGGRLIVQTRVPDHPVLRAVLQAAPDQAMSDMLRTRQALRLPPFEAIAHLGGAGAASIIEQLRDHHDLRSSSSSPGSFLLRADSHEVLCNALATVVRPAERVRVEVDPLRI
jgi:primosomal protein N' (replication factor Y) (superfamily II helicase)